MGNKHNTVKRMEDYNEYTVMLVGSIGAGKSSLGNFLLQEDVFYAADGLERVTNDSKCGCKMITDKIKLRVIDTPGFGDFRNYKQVRQDLASAFYEEKDRVDAFIFVISSVGRIGREMVNYFKMFEVLMNHEYFYDYVIPIFTKVDLRLKKRGEKDINSYEKQERIINQDLAYEGLQIFNDKNIAKAKDRWMCVSSTSTGDQFYYDMIIKKLLCTIDGVRINTGGMVCTTNIMRQAKDMDAEEMAKNKNAEKDEIRKVVLQLIPQIPLQGEGFMDLFIDYEEGHKQDNEQGATAI